MLLLPSASGTTNSPPLIAVPGGAVAIAAVWQVAQPTSRNQRSPASTSARDRAARRRFRRAHEVGERDQVHAVVLGIGHADPTRVP